MFIAHLPAAVLLAQTHPALSRARGWFYLGAVAPDIDMLVFYLWDDRSVHHHSYLTHRPAAWLGVLALGLMLDRRVAPWVTALAAGGLLHMALDSIAGQIAWGWPLSNAASPLVVVPATYDWWVASFVLHWSFGVELVISALAACVLWRERVQQGCTLRDPP